MGLNKHVKALLLAVTASTGLLIGVSTAGTTTAHATTWHKGTPVALRGTWETKPVSQYKFRYNFILGKSTLSSGGGPGDGTHLKQTAYHHKAGSRYYYVRGHEWLYTAGHDLYYYRFYKVGNKFKATNYLHYYNGKFIKGYGPEGHLYYKQ